MSPKEEYGPQEGKGKAEGRPLPCIVAAQSVLP